MNSYHIMEGNENIKSAENPNFLIQNYDKDKKISKDNFCFNNNSKENNNVRSISNKQINLLLGQQTKINRIKKDSNVTSNTMHKIYIDAGK